MRLVYDVKYFSKCLLWLYSITVPCGKSRVEPSANSAMQTIHSNTIERGNVSQVYERELQAAVSLASKLSAGASGTSEVAVIAAPDNG